MYKRNFNKKIKSINLFYSKKNIGSLPRIFISSILLITFFYSMPIIVNFAKNKNTAFQNLLTSLCSGFAQKWNVFYQLHCFRHILFIVSGTKISISSVMEDGFAHSGKKVKPLFCDYRHPHPKCLTGRSTSRVWEGV